jgi:hypothetical protein
MILLETIQRDCPPDLSGGFFLIKLFFSYIRRGILIFGFWLVIAR